MEAIPSSKMSVNEISTRSHIPEDGILHSHRRENLKSHNKWIFCTDFFPKPANMEAIALL
jgi:hypothetical protein